MSKKMTPPLKNQPYRKELVNGIVQNPITKQNPYLHQPNVYFQILHSRASRSTRKVWDTVQNRYFKGKTAINI